MNTLVLCAAFLTAAISAASGASPADGDFSAILVEAAPLEFPGVLPEGSPPGAFGGVDCNSPAHWDGGTLYMFYSTGHPFRSSGTDVAHLSPSKRVGFDNEAGWKMGGRWIEATHKDKDGTLYMWYHTEPPVLPSKTAPRIGCMVSNDNGMAWRDLGIVLEAPPDSNNVESANHYFVGGNGDFSVVPSRDGKYFYFFISTYNKAIGEQGVSVARMAYEDRNNPIGKVFKWFRGEWNESGIGGHVTPIVPVTVDWHRADTDAFWGPSVHFNTYLDAWVMLLNRAKDKDWTQEGIYLCFNKDIAHPDGWSKPVKILDASQLRRSKWYPEVIGADTSKRETDKIAGKEARLFVAGVSNWQIVFLKPGEKAPAKK